MGNIHGEVSKGERIVVGDTGEIMLRKIKKYIGRQVVEDAWIAEYFVGRTSCEFCLIKINRNKQDEELSISLRDDAPGRSNYLDFEMNIRVEEDLLLPVFHIDGPRSMVKLPKRISNNPHSQGGVLESTSYFYGRDTDERKGLIIILEARRSTDEVWPYMITVKHYLFVHAYSSDVGLCVVTKIRNDYDEGLSFQLERPMLQPRRYLLSMFDEVMITGWRPSYSVDFAIEPPDGAKKNNFSAAEAEPSGCDYCIIGQQNVFYYNYNNQGQRAIINSGTFKGNGNGGFIGGNFDASTRNFR